MSNVKKDPNATLHPVRELFNSYDIAKNGIIDKDEMKGNLIL